MTMPTMAPDGSDVETVSRLPVKRAVEEGSISSTETGRLFQCQYNGKYSAFEERKCTRSAGWPAARKQHSQRNRRWTVRETGINVCGRHAVPPEPIKDVVILGKHLIRARHPVGRLDREVESRAGRVVDLPREGRRLSRLLHDETG